MQNNSFIELSIIIPCFNSSKFLEECLDSILTQDSNDIEVILVDDGSTDETLEIIQSYKSKFLNLKILCSKKQNVSIARNTGIKEAKGKYIYFCDSDDVVSVNLIAALRELIKLDDDLIMFKYKKISSVKEINEDRIILKKECKILSCEEAIHLIYSDKDVSGYLWNKCFKRKFVLDNNLWLDEEVRVLEDLLFVVQSLKKARKVLVYDESLYFYRFNPNSVINTALENKNIYGKIKHYEELLSFEGIENIIENAWGEMISSIYRLLMTEKLKYKVEKIYAINKFELYKKVKYKKTIKLRVKRMICFILIKIKYKNYGE